MNIFYELFCSSLLLDKLNGSVVIAEIIEMRHWPTISVYGVLTRSAGKKYLEYLPIGGHVNLRTFM